MYADLSPLFAFLFVIGMVFLLDRERASHPHTELAAAEAAAERRAGALADVLGNEISARLASFAAAKVNFAYVSDPASEAAFMTALDSVIVRMDGVVGVAVVYPETERTVASHATGLGRAVSLEDSTVRLAYLRALGTHRVSATAVVEYGANRWRRRPRPSPRSSSHTEALRTSACSSWASCPYCRSPSRWSMRLRGFSMS